MGVATIVKGSEYVDTDSFNLGGIFFLIVGIVMIVSVVIGILGAIFRQKGPISKYLLKI